MGRWLYLIIGIIVVGVLLVVRPRDVRSTPWSATPTDVIAPEPGAQVPGRLTDIAAATRAAGPGAPALERPEEHLLAARGARQRLAGSQGALGRGLLALLSRDN
ncbi:MAG: hypothetical protein U0R78_09715 [Nocardioidaceae bacterium]